MTGRLGNFVEANRTDEPNVMFYDSGRMNEWTLADFRSIPQTLSTIPDGTDSMVIVPAADGEELHDSGYRTMSLVFFGRTERGSTERRMLGRTVYGHDHLQFLVNPQPTGGPGFSYGPVQASGYEQVEMDCLPTSGLLRVWLGTDNGFAPTLLMSSAMFRPARAGPDLVKTDIHSDQLKDIKRKMMEWAERIDHAQLRVALDEAMEGRR